MKTNPLDQVPELLPQIRRQLSQLWICDLTQLGDALRALPAGPARDHIFGSEDWAPIIARLGIAKDQPPGKMPRRPLGGLGLVVPPAGLTNSRLGRLSSPTHRSFSGSPPLPPGIDLTQQFPSVRDQGQRGTCVAFAGVALMEFLYRFSPRFSEQFCYWACKQEDVDPESGTSLDSLASAIEHYGICAEACWPYSDNILKNADGTDNESHHPPPAGAETSALPWQQTGWQLIDGHDVLAIKAALAGVDGAGPRPIVVGVKVYDSGFGSARAAQTGEISLPFPGEILRGGHAMCAVGYKDDDQVPGGGYFIVRNSWGTTWASGNRCAPGHALLPYAYITECGIAALAGPLDPLSTHGAPVPSDPAFSPYAWRRVMGRQTAERREWLGYKDSLAQGVLHDEDAVVDILANPRRPLEFRADTAENREKFKRQWCGWTAAAARLTAEQAIAAAAPALGSRLASARLAKPRHLGALDENLKLAEGKPFPYVHVPLLVRLAPYEWEPKVASVRLAADITEQVLNRWELRHRPEGAEPWPEPIRALLDGACGALVYELSGYDAVVQVLVAWMTPIIYTFDGPRLSVEFDSSRQSIVETIREAFEAWRSAHGGRAAHFAFYSIGVAGPYDSVPEDMSALVSGNHWEIVWSCDSSGNLVAAFPERVSDRLSLRDFSDRLLPLTFRERVARVKSVVDELRDENYGGRITVDLVRGRTGLRQRTNAGELSGYRQSLVLDAFLKLQDESPDKYRVEKANKDDDLTRGGLNISRVCIVEPSKARGFQVTAASMRRRFLRKHGLRVIAVAISGGLSLAASKLGEHLGLSSFWGFLLFLPLAYLGNLLGAWLNRRADRSDG